MPVTVFENTSERSLTVTLEPNEQRYELPKLARIGVRYSSEDGGIDRTFVDIGEYGIQFWCESDKREVEILHPTSFDLLLWDTCVKLGFCGSRVNGEPTHVTELLPAGGEVTAEEFARLVIRAEGGEQSSPDQYRQWIALLSAAFIEHMGASTAPAGSLVQNLAQPFETET